MEREKPKGLWERFLSWFFGENQDSAAPAPTEPARQAPVQELPEEKPEPPKPAEPLYKEKVYKVAGLNYHMDSIMDMAEENEDYSLKKKELVEFGMTDQRIWKYEFSPYETELVPEPDNPEDPKAIKVIVNGVHIGYIKAGSCAHLLKVIREDRIIEIDCDIYGGPYKYVSEVWDDHKEDFTYNLEKAEVAYGAKLTIKEK